MSLHKRTATLTIPADASVTAPASARYDEEDIRCTPARDGRVTFLRAVEVSDLVGSPNLTVRELEVWADTSADDTDNEPDYSDEEYPGKQLFYIEQPEERTYFVVDTETRSLRTDEDGAAVSAEYVSKLINTSQVRVELNGQPGESLTVGLIYETAGDQRF